MRTETQPAGNCPVDGRVRPRAWAIFVTNGNARMWTTFQPHIQKLADAEDLEVTPLYDQAALDAAVARLCIQVRQADERGDLATRRAHAALAALERIEKMPGEECFEYRRIALEALAADVRLLDGA